MPYITRDDGERFVIPSYRDVLSIKNKNLLKKDILLLSQSYGEYITLQKKGSNQYEVAFSPDQGYLLGESIWYHFQRPLDMIYCEALPNSIEAILVIVKSGSVYLDGAFPIDSIPEELVIFLTQKNNFEIYIYGDVPISDTPEEGKFSFEASSIKSFTRLERPLFQNLPLYKIYQLKLVDIVLKEQGIGVFPLKQLLTGIFILGFLWFIYEFLLSSRPELIPTISQQQNPYQAFNDALATPAPDAEMRAIINSLSLLYTMPGWSPSTIEYTPGLFTALVKSNGGSLETLMTWADHHLFQVDIRRDGIYLTTNFNLKNRPIPDKIYPIKDVMAVFIDKLSRVYPGNHIQINGISEKGPYNQIVLTLSMTELTPIVLTLIGDQFKDLPFAIQKVNLTLNNGNLSGSISLQVLGG